MMWRMTSAASSSRRAGGDNSARPISSSRPPDFRHGFLPCAVIYVAKQSPAVLCSVV